MLSYDEIKELTEEYLEDQKLKQEQQDTSEEGV